MESDKTDGDVLDLLNSKHRKERKELQSTIQSLKKGAAKGDKRKRKEVLEEISRKEAELEKRQADELIKFQNERNPVLPTNINSNNDLEAPADELNNQPRVSKAQRRRNKKALEEKQREEDILAREEENKNGPREMETRTIEGMLKQRRLRLHPIASDGNCLYNAIIHQLEITGRGHFTIEKLREQTADYILDNKQNLIVYMTNSTTGEILTDDEFTRYCENIRNTPSWGGQVEIKALSSILHVPIEVLQASGPPTVQGSEYGGQNLIVTYHRFMYSLGEHYNSTLPLVDEDDIENIQFEIERNIPEASSV